MDYSDILKRAWKITWDYKILWLFGLLAGAGSGGGGGSSSSSSNMPGSSGGNMPDLESQMSQYLPIIIVVGLISFAIAIAWFVAAVAARGGLVHLGNEAASGRPVKAGDGWSLGFKRWGRVFFLDLVISLPILIIVGIFVVVLVMLGVGAGVGGSKDNVAAVVSALSGMCLVLVIMVAVIIALGIILGITRHLGLRYAILEDLPVMESLKRGWADLFAKRGAVVMFFILYGVSIGYSIVVGVIAAMFAVPAIAAFASKAYVVGILILMVLTLILILPSAVYATFVENTWTIFFRRMRGMEVATAGAPTPMPPGGPGFPPAPPVMPAPPAPAPPVMPEPSVPEPPVMPAPSVPEPTAPSDVPPPPPATPAPPEPPAPGSTPGA